MSFTVITPEYVTFLQQRFPTLNVAQEHQSMLVWLKLMANRKKHLYPSQRRLYNWCKKALRSAPSPAVQQQRHWQRPADWATEAQVDVAQIRQLREAL